MNRLLIIFCITFSIFNSKAQSNFLELPKDSLLQRLEGTWQVKYANTLKDTCRTFLTIHFDSDTTGTWTYSDCIEKLDDKLENVKSFRLKNDEGIKFNFVKKGSNNYVFRLYQVHPVLNLQSGYQDVELGNLGFNVMNLYPVELFKKIKEPEMIY